MILVKFPIDNIVSLLLEAVLRTYIYVYIYVYMCMQAQHYLLILFAGKNTRLNAT